MKKFLAVYTGTAAARAKSGWDRMDAKKRDQAQAAGMQAWGEWMAKNAARIVDGGGPLGKTKRTSKDGIADATNHMAGYVIIEAASLAAAAKLFTNHPHFSIFPGDAVEIMECLPVPEA